MIDSGGDLGVRVVGLLLLILLAISSSKFSAPKKGEIFMWMLMTSLLLPSIFVASLIGVDYSQMVVWVASIAVFPLVLMIVRANGINEKHFINSGLIFSLIIIAIFLGRVFQIDPLLVLHDFISNRAAGFFNEKAAYSEDVMPVVYFQGTLALVICATYSAVKKNVLAFFIIVLALMVAPSRAGVFVVMCVGAFIFLQNKSRLKALIVGSFLFFAVLYFILNKDFLFSPSGGDGLSVRMLHVESVATLFYENPSFLIFGNGPGSEFYSSGVQEVVNNIEISHLEVVRKFGVIFAAALFSVYIWVVVALIKLQQSSLYLAMIAHFIVSATNPVLFSIPAVIMFAMSVVRLRSTKANLLESFVGN